MTEAQWLAGTNPEKMLAFVLAEEPLWPLRLLRLFARQRKPPHARKRRLLMCACVRQVWKGLDKVVKRAVTLAEQFADSDAYAEEMQQAHLDAEIATRGFDHAFRVPPVCIAYQAAALASKLRPNHADYRLMLSHCSWGAQECGSTVNHGRLLQHIFGNPFRPYLPPASWPATILELANSFYTGQDCAPMLADALEEAGYAELGGHMRSEQTHPKGCWVLDLILGKS